MRLRLAEHTTVEEGAGSAEMDLGDVPWTHDVPSRGETRSGPGSRRCRPIPRPHAWSRSDTPLVLLSPGSAEPPIRVHSPDRRPRAPETDAHGPTAARCAEKGRAMSNQIVSAVDDPVQARQER